MLTVDMPRTTSRPSAAKTDLTPSVPDTFDLKKAMGKRIADLRKQRGWMLKEMAAKLDVCFSVYTKWEYGLHPPSVEKLISLSEIFQTSVDYILTGHQTEGAPLHNTRLLERLKALESLPVEDMEAAIIVLDGLVIRREVESSVSKRGSTNKTA